MALPPSEALVGIHFIIRVRKMPQPTDTYDAAIILGAMVRPDGSPSPALRRRVEHGVSLVQTGKVGYLLMSGGAVRHPVPEAEVMRNLALDLAVKLRGVNDALSGAKKK